MTSHCVRVQYCTNVRKAIDTRTAMLTNTSATFELHMGVPFINKWTPYKELLCKFSWIHID